MENQFLAYILLLYVHDFNKGAFHKTHARRLNISLLFYQYFKNA